MFDAASRYIVGMGAMAGVMYMVVPYMGPTLADSTAKEKEATLLTMRFSHNPALSSVDKDMEKFSAAQ